MEIKTFANKKALGAAAASMAAECIRGAVAEKEKAAIIAATGASQFDFLEALTGTPGIPWEKVTMFHLDEYVGLPETHPASFRRYLKERFISKIGLGACHLINPGDNPLNECRRVGELLRSISIDVAFVGIGENGHLAFNDPPADFNTEEPYLVVNLDTRCRQQQFGEGWFASLDDVPTQAISMSIRQILRSKTILCIVPEARKAEAVHATVTAEVSRRVPASILRTHPDTTLFLDRDSAALVAATGSC